MQYSPTSQPSACGILAKGMRSLAGDAAMKALSSSTWASLSLLGRPGRVMGVSACERAYCTWPSDRPSSRLMADCV